MPTTANDLLSSSLLCSAFMRNWGNDDKSKDNVSSVSYISDGDAVVAAAGAAGTVDVLDEDEVDPPDEVAAVALFDGVTSVNKPFR